MSNQCKELRKEYNNLKMLKAKFDLKLQEATTGTKTLAEVQAAFEKAKSLKAELEQKRDVLKDKLYNPEKLLE